MSSISVRRPAIAAIAAFAAITLAACSSGSGTTPEKSTDDSIVTGFYNGQELKIGEPTTGGELRVGATMPLAAMDPAGSTGGAGLLLMSQVFDLLFTVDAKGLIVPDLAESISSDDNITWTLKLRDGVNFSDGTPLDSAAVVAHITNVAREGSTSLQAADARTIDSMATPDASTVVFTLTSANSQFPLSFTDGSLSMIPSPTAVAAAGENFGLAPVGAGPFLVESFTPNGDARFVRNPDYWVEGLPHLDAMTISVVPEQSSRLAALQSGDLDISTFQTPVDAAKAESAGLTVLEQQWYSNWRLVPNTTMAPFDDIRVRQAMNMALDLDAINKVVNNGLSDAPNGFFTPNHPFAEETEWPTKDVAAAKKLIAEYTDETGSAPKFEVLTPQNDAVTQAVALMQQMFKDVGIEMTSSVVTPSTLVVAALTGESKAVVVEGGIAPETLRRAGQTLVTNAGVNFGRGGYTEMDALLAASRDTKSEDERATTISEIQQLAAEWVPIVPFLSSGVYRAVGADVLGFPDGSSNPASVDHFEAKYVWVKK
ncbi:ABC transporter substrate-binding protein [Salinibacterium hongtaonis]|uniref:Solute-binding protein family 5 domain-containing protein n=1 Tax=Homoserinimonas hongtaonis TaxID=2079791 RepID=A0A2U1T2N0_9MICO|nr:ABC transporter substrate-binding protein [Salinibacterium hongtaonis]PWB98023.1 hypothetical protein DF220_09420 [Salinibacterium hongtaonis]